MEEQELLSLLGFVKVSPCRMKTLKSIGKNYKIPSEIARDIDARTSQVSGALSSLKERKMIVCLNEDVKKGRIYKCTDLGLKILDYLEYD